MPIDPTAFHDFEHAGWERAAEHYADAFGGLTMQMAGPLLDAVRAAAGMHLLDVATGPGFVAAAAAARGATVTGLDFSSAMIAAAKRQYPRLTFRHGDAEALPFDAASFDAVVMNFGLLHLARPEAAIAEACRVLRPGGRYGFTVWALPAQAVGFGMVLRALEEFGNTGVPLPEGPAFFTFADPDEARRSLTGAGFHDVDVRTVPLTWRLSSAGGVYDALSRGGVRTAALLRAQTQDALASIERAVRDGVEAYASGAEYHVPMPAVLASGVRLG